MQIPPPRPPPRRRGRPRPDVSRGPRAGCERPGARGVVRAGACLRPPHLGRPRHDRSAGRASRTHPRRHPGGSTAPSASTHGEPRRDNLGGRVCRPRLHHPAPPLRAADAARDDRGACDRRIGPARDARPLRRLLHRARRVARARRRPHPRRPPRRTPRAGDDRLPRVFMEWRPRLARLFPVGGRRRRTGRRPSSLRRRQPELRRWRRRADPRGVFTEWARRRHVARRGPPLRPGRTRRRGGAAPPPPAAGAAAGRAPGRPCARQTPAGRACSRRCPGMSRS